MQVELLRQLKRLRKLEPRLRHGPTDDVAETDLMERLDRLDPVIDRCRRDFLDAIAHADDDEVIALYRHFLSDPTEEYVDDEVNDWAFKYAAFNVAYLNVLRAMRTAGANDKDILDALEAASPAVEIGNAIAGSAAHALPLAGGVYKEIKDNIEGIVSLAKSIPGGAARVYKAGKKGLKRVFGGKKALPSQPAPAIAGEEGPASVGA